MTTNDPPPLDDYALGRPVLDWIYEHFEPGASILEFGSGVGTAHLVAHGYEVTSVEHDPDYLGKVEGARYVWAPIDIETGWYTIDRLVHLCLHEYDLTIVDGPPGKIGRRGLLDHLHLQTIRPWFDAATVIVDDVHRGEEFGLLLELAGRLGRSPDILPSDRQRSFGVIVGPRFSQTSGKATSKL